jgi:predicted secreted Zn-dependent protease
MHRSPPAALLILLAGAARAEVTESLDYYDYTARPSRGQTLRQALDDASPIREDGELFHGHTKWHIRWAFKWWREADGRCRITSNRTTLDLEITLPELQGGSAAMQRRFASFRDALHEHELGHAQIARDTAEEIDREILGLPEMDSCDELEAEANRVGHAQMRESKRLQKQFDEDTEHGRSQGASPD